MNPPHEARRAPCNEPTDCDSVAGDADPGLPWLNCIDRSGCTTDATGPNNTGFFGAMSHSQMNLKEKRPPTSIPTTSPALMSDGWFRLSTSSDTLAAQE